LLIANSEDDLFSYVNIGIAVHLIDDLNIDFKLADEQSINNSSGTSIMPSLLNNPRDDSSIKTTLLAIIPQFIEPCFSSSDDDFSIDTSYVSSDNNSIPLIVPHV
jgi:hypothetical protein